MLASENPAYQSQEVRDRARKLRRLNRPTTAWGWVLWLLIAVLFLLLISYVIAQWWYPSGPTDVPPANSNTMKT